MTVKEPSTRTPDSEHEDNDDDRGYRAPRRRRREPRIEEMPPPSKSAPKWAVLLTVAALLAFATFYGGYRYIADAITPRSAPGELVDVTLRPDSNTDEIARLLADKGVISRPTVFAYWSKAEGKKYQAGNFKLAKNSSYAMVADVISKPLIQSPSDKLTIPEGLTVAQIGGRVGTLPGRNADRFKAADQTVKSPFVPADKKTLEGVLFPATYDIKHTDTEQQVVEKMAKRFELEANRLNLNEAAKAKGKSAYDIIIIASLIEKEAKLDQDRPLISQVIWNRLSKDMPLQVDATVIYAQGKAGDPNYRVNKDALKIKSPYNTYNNDGLPPTPIDSPGLKSLQAALNPTPGDYLYYVVSDKNGAHAFAKTSREHEANVKKAQAAGIL